MVSTNPKEKLMTQKFDDPVAVLGVCIRAIHAVPAHHVRAEILTDANANYEYLLGVLRSNPNYPNSRYNATPAVLNKLLLLAANNPDEYHRIFGEIASFDQLWPDTPKGINWLRSFIQLLKDDHNYGLDPTGTKIIIDGYPYIDPQSMLEFLQNLETKLA